MSFHVTTGLRAGTCGTVFRKCMDLADKTALLKGSRGERRGKDSQIVKTLKSICENQYKLCCIERNDTSCPLTMPKKK